MFSNIKRNPSPRSVSGDGKSSPNSLENKNLGFDRFLQKTYEKEKRREK